MTTGEIEKMLHRLLASMPAEEDSIELVEGRGETTFHRTMADEIPRFAFQLATLQEKLPKGAAIADIGGGVTIFGVGAIEMGFEYYLVDDFSDSWHHKMSAVLDAQRALGVKIVSIDLMNDPLPFEPGSIDAMTTFDCLEHLHGSPRNLLHSMMAGLKPGGLIFIGVPNCVNLRKRITVPFGRGKWSTMEQWYGEPVFRGHVREPDTGDLRFIARDLDLHDVEIVGRNWLFYIDRYDAVGPLRPMIDRMLQLWPSACSNIYLLGRK